MKKNKHTCGQTRISIHRSLTSCAYKHCCAWSCGLMHGSDMYKLNTDNTEISMPDPAVLLWEWTHLLFPLPVRA